MIDVGFNIFAWAVWHNKSISFLDAKIQQIVGRRDPYKALRINKLSELDSVSDELARLASGMGMSRNRLFVQQSDSFEWLCEAFGVFGKRRLDIEGDVQIDDEGSCIANVAFHAKSKKGTVQMSVACRLFDLLSETRCITNMIVRFWSGDKPIDYRIDIESINQRAFFKALRKNARCNNFLDRCKMLSKGPDSWAVYLRKLKDNRSAPWQKQVIRKPSRKISGSSKETARGAATGSKAIYSASFNGDKYQLLQETGAVYWEFELTLRGECKYSVYWGDQPSDFLDCIVQNDYAMYDELAEMAGLIAKPVAAKEPAKSNTGLPKVPVAMLKAKEQPKGIERPKAKEQPKKYVKQEELDGVENLTVPRTYRRPVEHVHIEDLIVRSRYRTCPNKDHEIREVIAIVCIYSLRSGPIDVAVDAFCCPQCRRYYVLENDFDRLMRRGAPCCKLVIKPGEVQDFIPRETSIRSEISLYRRLGYNVNAKEGLSAAERRSVLDFVIVNRFRTQKQAINHLESLINFNGRAPNMDEAVAKWRSDIDYLISSRTPSVQRVRINKIYLGSHGAWR